MLKFRKTALIREENPIKETIDKLKKKFENVKLPRGGIVLYALFFAKIGIDQTSLLKL